jgi:hypothetical protein
MESPFYEHFHTNYVPTDDEIKRIRAHLVPHEAELARLDSLIRQLTAQRDRVKDRIESHKALISHARRLPQDLVEQIFLACLPTHHNAIMSPAEPPLLLGRISAWRSVAFSMPRLWTSLHVSQPFVGWHEERQTAVVEWLERSAPLPLELSVNCGWQNDNTRITSLLEFSARWRRLHVSGMWTADFSQTLASVDAPMLVDIHITLEYTEPADMSLVLSSNLFRRMKSGQVTIIASVLTVLVPPTPFTWDHLVHLTLKCRTIPAFRGIGLSPQSAYRLLEGCTSLRSLNFELSGGPLTPWSDELLLLPILESLIITPDLLSLEELAKLLEHLVMPNLGQFHIRTTLPVGHSAFLARLAENSPLITDLDLNLIDLPTTSFIPTIQSFPCLAKLSLVASYVVPDNTWANRRNAAELLGILTPNTSSPNPCPTLNELHTESEWFEDEIWMTFLQKQLDYGTNLRRFRLHFQCDPPNILPDIQSFATRGLDVALKYGPVDKVLPVSPWEGIEHS